jgi:alginate O-acetyltransferase complex protein AlgJ
VGGDVVNFSEEGKGPFAPMAEFLELVRDQQNQDVDQTSFRLVIWEIPERYLVHRDYVFAGK